MPACRRSRRNCSRPAESTFPEIYIASMCLILLALRAVPNRQWLLLGNRDEYHGRPSAPAARWNDAPNIIGGRDLEAGGSWLAVSNNGRFAAVTNVRPGAPPRGKR